MKTIGKLLVSSKNISKSTFIWNTVSTFLNSFQTALILLFLTRYGSPTDNSYLVMAFAVANLFFVVGKYGVRQFQVTDGEEEYSFQDYICFRAFTIVLMLLAEVGYVIYGIAFREYTSEKVIIVLIICIYRGVEAFEDVLHGRMQQKGRLDVAAKIFGIRLILFVVGSSLSFVLTRKLILSFAINTIISLVLSVLLNMSVVSSFLDNTKADFGRIKKLFFASTPLFLTMLMSIYISNAPKYVIDGVVADEIQTGFNIVFMPVFAVNMMSNFIFNPILKDMGDYWKERDYEKFVRMISKLFLIPIILCVPTCVIGGRCGIPILQFVYGIDLVDIKSAFIILLISSGIIAMMNLFIMILTTMRKQVFLLIGIAVGALVMFCAGMPVLRIWGVNGVCFLHMITLIFVTVLLIIFTIAFIELSKRKDS